MEQSGDSQTPMPPPVPTILGYLWSDPRKIWWWRFLFGPYYFCILFWAWLTDQPVLLGTYAKLSMYRDDYTTVIAYDIQDAKKVQREFEGSSTDDQEDAEWYCVPDDVTVRIHWNEHGDFLADHGPILAMTAREWVKKQGRCWLCSTEY